MHTDEVIVYSILDELKQQEILKEAIDYALLSIPFTFDRLGNRNLTKNIVNIAKGKMAENFFYHFCSQNGIKLNAESLSTPFYQADRKDFLYKELEWDIKNNFLIHHEDVLPLDTYLEQSALIPNRGNWDQWSKRNIVNLPESKGSAYVFTFMKKGSPDSKIDFLKIKMNLKQKNYMLDLYEQYQGKYQYISPYESEEFWNKFHSLGPQYEFEISKFPNLIITGIALMEDFKNFENIKPSDMKSPYLRTIIENMGIKIKELQSFKKFVNLK